MSLEINETWIIERVELNRDKLGKILIFCLKIMLAIRSFCIC